MRERERIEAYGYFNSKSLIVIMFFQGLSKDKDKRDDNVQNSFWVYNIQNSRWSCIYRNENVGEKYWSKMQDYEPCPRFAHQLVYDHTRKVYRN